MEHCVITEEQIREVLREDQGWFMPQMSAKELILDNYLTDYPYIVVRVFTSVMKETGLSTNDWTTVPRVFAFDLKSRRGWIKTRKVQRLDGWQNKLLMTCRDVWRIANRRAREQRMKKMTIDEWREIHGGY
jgi:hypothetical protein